MKLKCIVVDDEHLARTLLEEYINKLPELELIAKCASALEANSFLLQEEIDILFLDIQMPDLSGLDFLKTLSKKPHVILTTAYAEYAVEGFQLDVTDYLLKPISLERFMQAVNKVIKRTAVTPKGTPTASETADHFFVKADHKKVKVRYADILYVEGLKEYISIYVPGQRIITLESLKNMEAMLPKDKFARVHKSYIVAFEKIDAVSGHAIELAGKNIPVGKSYRQVLDRF